MSRAGRELVCLGVDHTFADERARALLSLDAEQQTELLRRIGLADPDAQAVILATCSRTELYLEVTAGHDADALWHEVLRATGRTEAACRADLVRRVRRNGVDAVAHLFRVACGLESRLVGEPEILGQVRDAHRRAHDVGVVGKSLHQLFRMALRLGKEARQSTSIGHGAAGIGAAIAATVDEHRPAVGHQPRILLLGAGVVAASATTQLLRRGHDRVWITNRTSTRGDDLARRHDLPTLAWAKLPTELDDFDVVASTVAGGDLGLPTSLGRSVRLWLDAGQPASITRSPERRVIGLDDLSLRGDAVYERRLAAIPDVERMVAAMVAGWQRWSNGLATEHVRADLFAAADRRDLSRLAQGLGCTTGELADRDRRELRRLVHQRLVVSGSS